MGNIYGRYEARPDSFLPGGASLHSCMAGHGPDSQTFDRATNTHCQPHTACPTTAWRSCRDELHDAADGLEQWWWWWWW